LHQLNKPVRKERKYDDLPSLNSSDEEDSEEVENSPFDTDNGKDLGRIPNSEDRDVTSVLESDWDAEMPYEQLPRKRRSSWDNDDEAGTKKIKGLPIKLPDGTIRQSTKMLVMSDSEQSSDGEYEESTCREPETRLEDVSTGARFGRAAVVDVVGKSSRRERVEAAKEQIASICQEILAEPENSVRESFPAFISTRSLIF
jgi:nucleolar complex protein 3